MAQSRFININSYCIVEYIAEQLGSLNFLTQDITLVQNSESGVNQIYNNDGSYSITKNIKDLTVSGISLNKVAYLDSEKIPNYIDYDTNLTETSINGYSIIYDTVRFHFISGFDLEGFKGIVLSVRNTQNNGITNIFANILVAPETIDSLIIFNNKPLFLSDSIYDRYIDIKVPSIKNINETFKLSPTPQNTFVAKITPTATGYSGFIYNSPITISVAECGKREKLSTNTSTKYDIFEITEYYESSVSQTNEFDEVGAQVQESSNGDFLEYYLTYDGGFPEELISILNRRNPQDEWIIIHQLSIFEQIGSAFINTSRQVIFQEDDFDEPLTFRPVLKNAGTAISMSVDILCRLTNKRTGEQIIREASFTLISPKKYGKSLINIPLTDEPQSQKIYNKIIKKNFEATKLFIEPTFAPGFNGDSVRELNLTKSVEYVPIFFSNNNISISNNSGILKNSDISDTVIFGPGKLRFIISPFDNNIKFKLFNIVNSKSVPLDLNLNAASYRLVFKTDSGDVAVENSKSDTSENLAVGEITFKIAKKESAKITKSKSRVMYITSVAQEGTETMMYSGEWRLSSNQSDVDLAIKEARSDAENIKSREDQVTALENKISELENNDAEKLDISNISPIKKVATSSIVNKIGMKDPKKIKTEVSNAGKRSSQTN